MKILQSRFLFLLRYFNILLSYFADFRFQRIIFTIFFRPHFPFQSDYDLAAALNKSGVCFLMTPDEWK